jgi:aspartate-semialdehyde dehydrogenase
MSRVGVAVLGATGAVGQRFVERLQDHPWFELRCLVGDGSAGRTYGEAVTWLPATPLKPSVAARRIVRIDDLDPRDVSVVFSALPSGKAGPIESLLAARGFAVFTNARDHRLDGDVPLLIPEVNPEHLALVARQRGPGLIVANGNCSAIILTLGLAPLHRGFGVADVHVATLQGLSGAGYPGVSALDIVDNVVPFIGGEEEKLEVEPRKTLGVLRDGAIVPDGLRVQATCTRVAVREGHLVTVHARLSRQATLDEVLAAWEAFRPSAEVAALPSAPARPIELRPEADRPQPRRDRDAGDGMAVSVGRVRLDEDGRGLRFVVLGHNTIRGAAGQSVLNAEFALARGLLPTPRTRVASAASSAGVPVALA